ncbi:hypothetical protein [Pseudomonas brassicacearum]|uniref:Uncharacterized protein n=1 Tax=Pseudomonas brassicacearum TaxID=930166 RepID=A0A423GJZ0_9PSED|nr:hypothetical protein [Pseudomonas brassicacearum]ROM90679.1 hypothetical protein BK658_25135 [Pseudomonas brassicacearum]
MNILAYEFTAAQRHVLDRYTHFLGSLHPTFNSIPVVFERRRRSGHQLAVLAKDSRLDNAQFNERYLQAFWGGTEETRLLCSAYVEDLATFTRESLEITRQFSRNEPIGQVDFRLYSLSRSPTWMLFPPKNVQDLVHELTLRLYDLRATMRQLKYTIEEVYRESFGLKAVFTSAMNHQSCNCHPQPTVAEELFCEVGTTPVWDITYSSRDASIRAAEYKSDIVALFSGFVSVNSQMGLFIEEVYQRIDGVINELLWAKSVSKLGELNFKLGAAMEGTNEYMAMLNHLEAWLRN